ncbi:MAG: diguanylate cyclase [Lachnospiraceae bacterium]|nr:diguanylate cyclase [Lachnospiraceae bacterium]
MNKEKRSLTGKIKEMWDLMGRSTFTGERLEQNLTALTLVSVVTAGLGIVLTSINIYSRDIPMLVASVLTLLGGVSCAFCAGYLKKRELAALIPTVFCGIVFTIYAFSAVGEGSALLWSLLLPIGLCYFVSVRNGIVLSVYYSILYIILFYTPLNEKLRAYYNDKFISRFPILYISISIFTGLAMYQYHKASLRNIEYTDSLNAEVAKQTAVAEERSRKIEQMSYQTIQTLANAIDAKDPYTKGHSTRVSQYAVLLAEALGWDEERVTELKYAALLHDIGKIGVPDSILNNPKKLTEVEYNIIKSHTTMGEDILKNKIIIGVADDIAGSHHERYDGRGYPRGLKGKEISEGARIVAIADAFDAMSSNRVYRKAIDKERIRNEYVEGRGRQFDPEFTDVFLKLLDEGKLELVKENERSGNAGEMEASSALLQQVMESFTTQDNVDITTGVLNRTSGEVTIAQAMKETPGCFAFFDVDNLKKINDTYGHEAGDKILKVMGECLKDHSENAVSCRLGGDEFLHFMKKVSKESAEKQAREIMYEFNEKKDDDPEISVGSLSAGLVMTTTEDTYISAYNRADKALYHVKQNGKGDLNFYSQEEDEPFAENINVNRLASGMHVSGSYSGAMMAEYREFTKLFEFITNLEKRFSHPFKLVMISLEVAEGETPLPEELEKAMYYMEQSIHLAMRSVDVMTRYSRQQFLVILLGTNMDGVKIVTDRIFRNYYKMGGGGSFTPSYSVADTEEKEEKKEKA